MDNDLIVTVAAGQPLFDLIQLCYAANRPVLLEGDTGIGKSEILRAFADSKGHLDGIFKA